MSQGSAGWVATRKEKLSKTKRWIYRRNPECNGRETIGGAVDG
jgi:hypothetical protein